MTKKLEDITKFVPFGYGMIGMTKSNEPATIDDPIIMFVHKRAVAGKFIDGEPVLKPREEKAMIKDVETLIAMLNDNFNHKEDFVNVGDNYNQPRGPRKRRVNPVVNTKAQPDVIEQPVKRRGGRRKAVETPPVAVVPEPRVKRVYRRKAVVPTPEPHAEIVPASTVAREREMAAEPVTKPATKRRVPKTNVKATMAESPDIRRTVRRKIDHTGIPGGKTKEVTVIEKRSRKRTQKAVPAHA